MTISLTHSFVSPKADGTDSTLVQPSSWNANHVISLAAGKLIGNGAGAAGNAQEITPSSNLSLTSGALDLASSITLSGTVTASMGSFTSSTLGAATVTSLSASGDITMSGTGEIKLPAGTTAQRSASPATGMFRYNTTLGAFEGYNGSAWGSVGGGGATGNGGDRIFSLNGQSITSSYSIPSGQNAFTVGPVTTNPGVSVTVPPGSRWVVL